jgi:hypothetical protein
MNPSSARTCHANEVKDLKMSGACCHVLSRVVQPRALQASAHAASLYLKLHLRFSHHINNITPQTTPHHAKYAHRPQPHNQPNSTTLDTMAYSQKPSESGGG